jgi:phi13 family phage major tail protein
MNKNLDEIVEYRGVTDLVIAEVLTDNNKEGEGYTTGEVIELAGVGEISKTTSNSSESKYYNNMAAIVINSTGADEIKCSVSVIPQDKLALITGQDYDEETGTLIEGERKVKYFALGYKTKKTNGDEIYVWRHKGTFNIPDNTHATENDGTDSNGQEVTYTGISTTHKFTKTGKVAKAINVDVAKDRADVSTFFNTVTTIDTLKAKTIEA